MKKLFFTLLIVCSFYLGVSEVFAQCQCKRDIPASRYSKPHEALKTSYVVFIGEIKEVQKGSIKDEQNVKFKVESV